MSDDVTVEIDGQSVPLESIIVGLQEFGSALQVSSRSADREIGKTIVLNSRKQSHGGDLGEYGLVNGLAAIGVGLGG